MNLPEGVARLPSDEAKSGAKVCPRSDGYRGTSVAFCAAVHLAPKRRDRRRIQGFFAAATFLLCAAACGGVADRSLADYTPCQDDLECKLGSNCFTAVGDPKTGAVETQMCSRACAVDTDCTGSAICVGALTVGAGICYQRCETKACHSGFSCVTNDVAGAPTAICLPS